MPRFLPRAALAPEVMQFHQSCILLSYRLLPVRLVALQRFHLRKHDLVIASGADSPLRSNPARIVTQCVFLASIAALLAGCSAEEILLTPDYGNAYYQEAGLERPNLEVVETHDLRNADSPQHIGTARTGFTDSSTPYRLDGPASEFITRSINALLGSSAQDSLVYPLAVYIDSLSIHEDLHLTSQDAIAECRLRFAFPVSDGSTSVTAHRSSRKAHSKTDVTSSLDDVLYQSIVDCTRQFLSETYDRSDPHLVDRASLGTDAVELPPPEKLASSEREQLYPKEVVIPGPWNRLSASYHLFAGDSMRDAYTGALGLTYMRGSTITPGLCGSVEVGSMLAWGTPASRPNSRWSVDDSRVVSVIIPMNGFLIYPDPIARTGSFRPYVGAGAGGAIGFEWMSADLSSGFDDIYTRNTVFRSWWTGGLLCGAEFGNGSPHPFVELRISASGRSRVGEGGLSDEDREQRAATLYDALERPNGNLTGGTVCAGIRW